MVRLLDLAPVAAHVSVRGKDIPITGLSITELRDLMAAFPDAASLFSGGIDAGKLLKEAPGLVAAAIALAAGGDGTPEETAAILKLDAGSQVKLLNAVIAETAPDGIGPFVELIASLLGGMEAMQDQTAKAQATTSRLKPRGSSAMATKPPM